jgi:hypothetical protein
MNADIKATDWAKLAAYIDGEGNITINETWEKRNKYGRQDRKRNTLMVSVHNTDARMLVWCKSTFGVGFIHLKQKHDFSLPPAEGKRVYKRSCWTWTCCSKEAEAILRGCRQYFTIKGEQADVAFAFRSILCKGKYQLTEAAISFRQDCRTKLRALKDSQTTLEMVQ